MNLKKVSEPIITKAATLFLNYLITLTTSTATLTTNINDYSIDMCVVLNFEYVASLIENPLRSIIDANFKSNAALWRSCEQLKESMTRCFRSSS